MNKRPNTGLPTKPYMPGATTPGPAPPLPNGPPPAQQAYGAAAQVQDPAAHAAAWAAYYQAQGVTPGTAYGAPAQPAAQAGAAANPYANYGYGAGAQHSSAYQPAPQHQAQAVAGPSQPYRPPPINQAYATAATQPSLAAYGQQGQVYSPQGAAGYATPQPQTQARPPYQAGQQQGYAWGAPQQPAQPQQAYRPPQAPAQGYQAQPAGPYYPQQQQAYSAPTQPFRPPTTPQAMQPNSPYRPPLGPGPQHQQRPPRPHMSTPPHPSGQGFPPAKRPRFDGPGGTMNGQPGVGMNNVRPPLGPSMQNQSSIRPPTAPAAFGVGVGPNGGQPGFNAGVGVGVVGGRNVSVAGVGRGGAPVPVSRPPIHLGGGGPPPQLGLGVIRGAGNPLRGGLGGRGRGGGPLNAPRGPSGMRRPDTRSSLPPSKKDTGAKGKDKKAEARTTMTDFRIVGIEVKELGWSWGKIGGEDEEEINEEKDAVAPVEGEGVKLEGSAGGEATVEATKPEADKAEGSAEVAGDEPLAQVVVPEQVKEEIGKEDANGEGPPVKVEADEEKNGHGHSNGDGESVPAAEAVAVEEKRGEKRKAKSPEAEDEIAAKKRLPYLLTHNKPNHASAPPPTAEQGASATAGSFDSNQNRFRIYFDSPPELDRIPKAERKNAGAVQGQSNPNPNKRNRRESSSVAPSRAGDVENEQEVEPIAEAEGEGEGEGEGEKEDDAVEKVEGEQPSETAENGDQPVESEPAPAAEPARTETAPADPIEGVHVTVPVPSAEATDEATNGIAETTESVAPVSTTEPEQATDSVPAVEAENAEEAGDVSMVTDPGAAQDEAPSAERHAEAPPAAAAAATEPVPAVDQAQGQVESVTVPIEQGVESTQEATESKGQADVEGGAEAVHPPTEVSAEEVAASLAQSAEATASAYKVRARRLSSVSTFAEDQPQGQAPPVETGVPSTNRLSILYEKSSRRICVDSDVVEKVRIWRKEGRIEVELKSLTGEEKGEGEEKVVQLPKGILIESYDTTDQRFVSLTRAQLSSFYPAETKAEPEVDVEPATANDNQVESKEGKDGEQEHATSSSLKSIPPFHRAFPSPTGADVEPNAVTDATAADGQTQPPAEPRTQSQTQAAGQGVVLTVYMNKRNPLSEPKWCRTNGADAWLYEQFGASSKNGWVGKLEVMDPDPAPTLKSMLEGWATSSTLGTSTHRRTFISTLLSSPLDTLEILLRLTRGERNPPFSTSAPSPSQSSILASTLSATQSPYAAHQTHVSLAVLAMYRLTTDLAERVGDKEKEAVQDKVADIVRSLPPGLISRSLDGMWREWIVGHTQTQTQSQS